MEFYAESNPEGASAKAPRPATLAYACVAASNPDQDGASADLPGTSLGNTAMGADTPKATNAYLDQEAACTYPPGVALAEAHDILYNNASKAPAKVPLSSKYDPRKKAELCGSAERFADLPMDPYSQKGLEGIILCA